MNTDYLVIGAGATGLAFADTLLSESNATITIVDSHAQPGGHWNDAYPFVALHQPSAFYGVQSLELGSGRKDASGHNQGLYELASGPAVASYFHSVMADKLLPSGRVNYLPMHKHLGSGLVQSLLSGAQTRISVAHKTVDCTHFSPKVPATSAPRYAVNHGARVVPPNGLVGLWHAAQAQPEHYCVIGAGKTGMDACVWLLSNGVPAERITWVAPRDSWLINRITTQPGEEFFEHSIGGQARQMQAFATATDIEDLFVKLEAAGQMLRIDTGRKPTMFHYATISVGEVELLRQIKQVVRLGRVRAVNATGLELEHGTHALPANTLCVDCSASAVEIAPDKPATQPVFQPGLIVPQLIRAPLVSLSASIIAWLEVHAGASDAEKNALCTPVPFPKNLAGFARASLVGMMNSMAINQNKALRAWMQANRLDAFSRLVVGVDPNDSAKMATLGLLKSNGMPAAGNLQRILKAEG
jgi:hypothetical protein